MIQVLFLHPRATMDHIGLIPNFLVEEDPRPASEQFDERYNFGGGWRPMSNFKMDPKTFVLKYPGDPTFAPIARIEFRKERIFIYEHAFVCIVQEDGSFSVARMD
jgi:hypothetical protein